MADPLAGESTGMDTCRGVGLHKTNTTEQNQKINETNVGVNRQMVSKCYKNGFKNPHKFHLGKAQHLKLTICVWEQMRPWPVNKKIIV